MFRFRFIHKFTTAHPMITLNFSTAFIFAISDLISQKITSKQFTKQFSLKRCLCYSIIGGLFVGPISFIWQKKGLPQIVVRILGHEAKMIKYAGWATMIDQLVCAPYIICGIYWLNYKISQKCDNSGKNIWETIKMSWRVWPAACILSTLIPYTFRVMFMNSIAIVWNIYLSDSIFRGR